MVSMEEIREMHLLTGLSDQMLEKILPLMKKRRYKDREVIYEEGENAINFYMLKRGKILGKG